MICNIDIFFFTHYAIIYFIESISRTDLKWPPKGSNGESATKSKNQKFSPLDHFSTLKVHSSMCKLNDKNRSRFILRSA